ncbi:uncharacterized protein BXZ73DRAFT_95882 [Epithele typhae]|uniref:uncharacterized protein n=1 Tax=Epithele typhae TaxID=378194 RepID=UPI002008BF53|nr:uncharacterized protein BXZ73DRAFT_95882 [Epithele typhae]KAH9946383.1 hypothetical protein BXZ73DRAFT_95882 [Epithele typhae]
MIDLIESFLPLQISRRIPFAPADGLEYEDEEDLRLFSMQPIEDSQFDSRLRYVNGTKFRPPLFRFAWPIDDAHMLKIILAKFPDAIKTTSRPFKGPLPNPVPEEYQQLFEYPDNPRPETEIGYLDLTLPSRDLVHALAKHIDLPRKYVHLVRWVPLCDKDAEGMFGLQVGTNYHHRTSWEWIEKLKAVLEIDEDPMWYLDQERLYWRRVIPLPEDVPSNSYFHDEDGL